MASYFNRGSAPGVPGHGKGYLHKAVPNASVSVSMNGFGLPANGTGFDIYGGGGRPGYKLNSVTVETGDSLGMVTRAEASFTCFTLGAFQAAKSTAMKFGKPMSVSIGYVSGAGSGGQGISVSNLMIYSFKWNLTKDNFFDCSVSGIAASTSILKAELSSTGWSGITFKDGTKDAPGSDVPVGSIPAWIRHTAQGGGTTTDDTILTAGEGGKLVGDVLVMKNPLLNTEEAPAEPDPATTAYVDSKLASLPGGPPKDTPCFYYITLAKLVQLINTYYSVTIKPSDINSCWRGQPNFKLDESATNAGIISPSICSAEPFKMLIPGVANYGLSSQGEGPPATAGKYLADDAGATTAITGTGINCGNILISANWLASDIMGPGNGFEAPDTATANKAAADTPKGTKFSFESFFKKLFDGISFLTGGAIKLQLVAPHSGNSADILIIALNSGTITSGASVFDPFSGNQAIRQLDLGCAPASADGFAIAVKHPSNAGPAKWNGEAASGTNQAAALKLVQDMSNSGLTNDKYSADSSKTLREALAAVVSGASAEDARTGKVAVTDAQFPMTFRATIQGHGGFKFGQRVTVAGIGGGSFMVTKVTHTAAENDWQSVVEAVWLGG